MKKVLILCIAVIAWTMPGSAQPSLLQAGPMVGYAEHREVLLWVQTQEAASVQFFYWDLDEPQTRYSTDSLMTQKHEAYTAKLIADQVVPGKTYEYALYINGQHVERSYPLTFQSLAQWKPSGQPPEFIVAAGSCSFVNDPKYFYEDRGALGGDYHIYESIYTKKPDLMLWLGDNIYLRNADWNTLTGIHYRYTFDRSLPELQPLLGSVHHYATWDDHDYGPDDSDRSFVHKSVALDAFRYFWGNPSFGMPDMPGVMTSFNWGDVDFFVLDNRTYRSPQRKKMGMHTMLGEQQIEWLMDGLITSRATFKVVVLGSMFLTEAPTGQNYAARYAEERISLLRKIEDEALTNIIFLTGDKHLTELSHYTNAKGHTVYDLSVSPLTASANTRPYENRLQVEGTLVQQRNFATLHFAGPLDARILTLRVFDSDGTELWSYKINAE